MTNPWDTPAVRAAAGTFQRLRTAPSKFSAASAAGDWNKDVDTYGGAKHEAMETVRAALAPETPHAASAPTTPASAIVQLLGEPDAVLPSRDAVRALMAGGAAGVSAQAAAIAGALGPVIPPGMETAATGQQQGGGSTFLVYFWRGTHDYLAFEVDAEGEQVKGSEWILAGE
ncbi:hypothetical protein GGF32_003439 [Allomyces javanicus]|nr:hypothetical protein GGF32_003439 [Allomyces javanicus]